MRCIHLFLIAVAALSVLNPHAAHADENNSGLLGGAPPQATAPDIAGTWIAGDIGYLKRVIQRLDDGSGDFELLPPPGAGPRGETLRFKWSAKDRRFSSERVSIDGKRRAITLIELDGQDLKITRTFDEESLEEMPLGKGGGIFPHVERWRRFASNAVPDADKTNVSAWETESQRLRRLIAVQEEAAVAGAAAIRELAANARGRSAQASVTRRKAALEKKLQEIFALKVELEQAQLQGLKLRLATLESKIEQRRQFRDRIVERRLQDLLEDHESQHAAAPANAQDASYRVDLPNGRSVEFVGITGNTRPADEGWRPDGQPLKDPGYWPATLVEYGEGSVARFPEGGKHPEPAANAIDVLLRFDGIKAQPSLVFDGPTQGSAFQNAPLKNPYEIRVATRRREAHPRPLPGGKLTSDHTWRIGFTDEEWGRFVTISKDGSVRNPIQPDDTFADTYKLVQVEGAEPSEKFGTAVLLRMPQGNTEPGNPLHRFAFELEAVDSQGKRHETTFSTTKNPGVYAYTLLEPLPPGETLSHFEYRLRPYRFWITFQNVALEPGVKTTVSSKLETFQSEKPRAEKRKPPVEVGATKKHDLFAWRHDSEAVLATGEGPEGDDVHFWTLTPQGASHERIGAQPHADALATSRRSFLLAAGTNAGTVHLWDPIAKTVIKKLEPPLRPYAIRALAISPDDLRIAAGGSGGHIYVYDLKGGVVDVIESDEDRTLADLKFSPDGKKLAAVDDQGTLMIWNVPARQYIADSWKNVGIAGNSVLQWSASGDRIALVSAGFVALVEPKPDTTPQTIIAPESVCLMIPKEFLEGKVPGNYTTPAGMPGGVRFVGATALSPDFQTVATVKIDGELVIWDLNTKSIIGILPSPPGLRSFEHSGPCLKRIAFSPNAATIAGVVEKGPIVFWTLEGASSLRLIDHQGRRASVNDVVQAQVGIDTVLPHDWIGRPGRDGLVSLVELPTSAEVLLAAGDSPTRTLFRLRKFPGSDYIAEQRLNPPTSPDLKMAEIKVSVETHVGQEILVAKLHNQARQELRVSNRDLQLQTEIPAASDGGDHSRSFRVRGLSPDWLTDRGPTGEIAIAPGQTGYLTVDWNDWFHNAYWSSREHEIAAEPALTPPADGQLLVRVCVGSASATPVQVTVPKWPQSPSPR